MASSIVADLQQILPDGSVSEDPQDLAFHSKDALARYRAFRAAEALESMPDAVARPGSTEEVAAVARYASERGVPLVPYGGGTGVMGGVVPVRGGIVLDMQRLNEIASIDPEAQTATVGPGIVLEQLGNALNARGLILGHDPWSLPIATVGGAISTNGVGYLAGRYGAMGEQVLGLDAVLATGDLVSTRGVSTAAGPSLYELFIGSEGTLGIITQATLRVFPAPEVRSLHAVGFSGFEAGFEASQEMHAVGLRPTLLDFDEDVRVPGEASALDEVLYLGFEGPREEVRGQVARSLSICRRHGGVEQSTQAAQEFWDTRHETAERYKREVLATGSKERPRRNAWRADYIHVSLPVSRVLEYRRWCQQMLDERGIPVRGWSLWGRLEHFSFHITDPAPTHEVTSEFMSDVVDELLSTAQGMGGSMEYCHGVGLKLNHLMERELGPGMELLRRVKKAVDPAGILNPGTLGL